MSTSALVVAHPGHELRVFHWMERTRPLYCCLTEGSGGAASSRMRSTDIVLERVGSPAELAEYRAIMEGVVRDARAALGA